VLKIGLERLGYAVTFANDPEEALSRFKVNPNYWNIVIGDQIMPEMKGVKLFEMLRQVRRHDGGRSSRHWHR
jgi:CheY-like chemotaxis protein